MSLKTYPAEPEFQPIVCISHKVTAAEATANSCAIAMPREIAACIAQIQTVTTGADYITAKTVLVAHVDNTSCTITVAGTDLLENSLVNIVAW